MRIGICEDDFLYGRRSVRDGFRPPAPGNASGMERDPGPLADEKLDPSSDPAEPEPQPAEVESARLLANETREQLRTRGLDAEDIRRLANQYVALDIGEDSKAFIEWASERGGSGLTG